MQEEKFGDLGGSPAAEEEFGLGSDGSPGPDIEDGDDTSPVFDSNFTSQIN